MIWCSLLYSICSQDFSDIVLITRTSDNWAYMFICPNKVATEILIGQGGGSDLAKALAKCLHSPLIGHALQFGLLFVQKTCIDVQV